MNYNYGFSQNPALVKDYLKGGALLTNEEGVWLTYESKPELVKAVLPECLDYVDPYVTVYAMLIGDSSIAPPFMETAIIVNASYKGKLGAYAPSFLMYGPGAATATFMGREIYGINKKFAETIQLQRVADDVRILVRRDGCRIFDCRCKLGNYNDVELGSRIIGMRKKGDSGCGTMFFFTYDAKQRENFDTEFTAVHMNETVSRSTMTADRIPGSIESIEMEADPNVPWSFLEVVRPVGCCYTHEELHMEGMTHHHDIGDPDRLMSKLMLSKFDLSAFGFPTRNLNAGYNEIF